MTALQDWLSISPVDPRSIKAVILDAWRGLTSETEETGPDDEPQVMGPGLERC